ncbi:hypothetical protein NN561_020236 [Cricetulus griseus]
MAQANICDTARPLSCASTLHGGNARKPLPQHRCPSFQVFVRKLRKAYGKSEWNSLEHLKDIKPSYKLDHIVKER